MSDPCFRICCKVNKLSDISLFHIFIYNKVQILYIFFVSLITSNDLKSGSTANPWL